MKEAKQDIEKKLDYFVILCENSKRGMFRMFDILIT